MGFVLGSASKLKLKDVHPDLGRVTGRAIGITTVDFKVLEGRRTKEKQKKLVASGASQTMNSRHLTGHAEDLVALVGAEVRWDWPLYYPIAKAMKKAAVAEGVQLTWGGVWDRVLNDLSDDLEKEVYLYTQRQKLLGKKAFIDGPHFQLTWKDYP